MRFFPNQIFDSSFIEIVAEGRGLSIEEVAVLATGEVWGGAKAKEYERAEAEARCPPPSVRPCLI